MQKHTNQLDFIFRLRIGLTPSPTNDCNKAALAPPLAQPSRGKNHGHQNRRYSDALLHQRVLCGSCSRCHNFACLSRATQTTVAQDQSLAKLNDFMATRDGLTLTKAFMRIGDTKLRRRIVDLWRRSRGTETEPDALAQETVLALVPGRSARGCRQRCDEVGGVG